MGEYILVDGGSPYLPTSIMEWKNFLNSAHLVAVRNAMTQEKLYTILSWGFLLGMPSGYLT